MIRDNKNKIERDFYSTLEKLSQSSIHHPDFSGIGLILYDPNVFDHSLHADLRPSITCPRNVRLGRKKALSLLLKISNKSHKLHDGFLFFDCTTGLMTHIAQYFFPPIVPGIELSEHHGTRYHSAEYGSCMEGVILAGILNCNNKYYIFKKGHLIEENESKKNNRKKY